MTIVAWLLLGQSLAYIFLSVTVLSQINIIGETLIQELFADLPTGLKALAFATLAFLTLMTSIGFFRIWTTAWLLAISIQGLSLLLSLNIYFSQRSFLIYPILLYNIIMVIYLNYSEVISLFRAKQPESQWGSIREL